jgi:hypothetical protein
MGKAAVALLLNQMENVSVYLEELLFEPELVVRGSTGPAPAAPAASMGTRPAPLPLVDCRARRSARPLPGGQQTA